MEVKVKLPFRRLVNVSTSKKMPISLKTEQDVIERHLEDIIERNLR
jgi:hypothetical protein